MTDSLGGLGEVTQHLLPGLDLTTGSDLFPGNLAPPGTHCLPTPITTTTTTTITTTTLAECHFGRNLEYHAIIASSARHLITE